MISNYLFLLCSDNLRKYRPIKCSYMLLCTTEELANLTASETATKPRQGFKASSASTISTTAADEEFNDDDDDDEEEEEEEKEEAGGSESSSTKQATSQATRTTRNLAKTTAAKAVKTAAGAAVDAVGADDVTTTTTAGSQVALSTAAPGGLMANVGNRTAKLGPLGNASLSATPPPPPAAAALSRTNGATGMTSPTILLLGVGLPLLLLVVITEASA
jgi:hypothetical protein